MTATTSLTSTRRAKRRIRILPALALAASATAVPALIGGSGVSAGEYPASHAQIGGSSHGFATFETKGDVFSLCDIRPDGYSVGLRWQLRVHQNWISQPNHYNSWGTDTCRSFGESSLPEAASIRYRACLYDHAKPGGHRPVVVEGSCGPWIPARPGVEPSRPAR
ncbi:hypothetical protein [Desertimonas flava]|jgi:hypothetical protein|uniref:hypothetical protein n=1 Tax=Desertimonas flava TaxID=2064846 RepID=UPI000E351CB7|nr:hypothetical protein [Desertimonas flava]